MRRYLAFILLCLSVSSVQAEVILAISNATTGPASELGKGLNRGAQLYFSERSTAPVMLDKKDDGYEPSLTMQNTVEHVNNGRQLLFNYVGTPTTKSIINFAYAKKLTLITPFTGADFLRMPSATHVFNLRASYRQEANLQAKYFVERLKLDKIAVVIQADAFGLAFEKYFINALANYGLKPVFISRFKRNTSDMRKLAAKVDAADIQALAFVGPYEPMSALVNQSFSKKPSLVYSSVSFVSSNELIKRIPAATKLLVTEVVPNPKTCKFKLCNEFRAAAQKKGVDLTHIAFEGYLNAYWLDTALQACDNGFKPSCIKQGLIEQPIEIFNKQRTFDRHSRQLLNQVFTTIVNLPAI